MPGSQDLHMFLYRQGVMIFEAKERKKFHEVSRRIILWSVRWNPYGCDSTDFSDLVGSSSSL